MPSRLSLAAAAILLALQAHGQEIPQSVKDAVARADAAIAKIVALPASERTFENTFAALDDASALLDGELPHFNLGTASGAACSDTLARALVAGFERVPGYTHVLNGRFKGGHITRHDGNPAGGVHAVQLEMSWRAYMDETPPYRWHDAKAAAVTPTLRGMIETMLDFKPDADTGATHG
jgi:N-formylglutamate deformylase